MAWVGSCRGLRACRTFGLAISARSANSSTPIARITFPRTGCWGAADRLARHIRSVSAEEGI